MEGEEQMAPAIRSILATARARQPPARSVDVEARPLSQAFEAARADGRVPIIAEIKPTSPTTDGIHDADPPTLARAMVDGGAAAISVLTEAEHFGGSPAALRAVREAVDVPVLRKDFILDTPQLDTVSADVILLIARFVDDLPRLVGAARDRGFQVLVEVHTPAELERAIASDVRFIGINNRDLTSLAVDRETFARVVDTVPPDADRTLIAESGISTVEDVRRMREAGADALLIGTAIMDGNVRENTRRLTQA